MKIGLTGATGFVGRNMVSAFIQAGHEITAVVRKAPPVTDNALDVCGTVIGDVLDADSLISAFQGCDCVINLVGIIRETGSATFERIHAEGAYNVVEACKKAGVPKLVQMSACGTRPNAPSRYHQTKWMAEETVRSSGLKWVILRPSLIFGVGDGFTTLLIDLIRKPSPFIPIIGKGDNLLQPISVQDVCACFVSAVESDDAGGRTYEIGGPDRMPYKDVVLLVARKMGSRKPALHIPAIMVRPVAEMMSRVTSAFPLTPDQLKMLAEDNIAEPNAAADVFGLNLRAYHDAMPEIIAEARK